MGAIAIALIFWQILAMTVHQKILLVSPLSVGLRLLTLWREPGFLSAVAYTGAHIICGFLLGTLTGAALAIPAAKFRPAEILLWPWMACIKSVPVASFVIICLIWLSAGHISVFISFLVVVPVTYQNLLSGCKSLDPKMEEMADIFCIKGIRRFCKVTLPQLIPYIKAALGVTLGMAWKAGVAAEVIGSPNGSIGKELVISKMYLNTDDLLARTVVIVILSVCFEKLFLLGSTFGLKKLTSQAVGAKPKADRF